VTSTCPGRVRWHLARPVDGQLRTVRHEVGTNTWLRWTFTSVGDLFVVYNHNIRSLLDRWQLDSNQLLVKLQYAFRM